MFEFIGVAPQALFGQLLLGLINGAFYAMLSLGLAVIFGLLKVINFAHGALYMMGTFDALVLLNWFGVSYWGALIVVPVVVGAFGILIERLLLLHFYRLDELYSLLLTFGLALIIETAFRKQFGASISKSIAGRRPSGLHVFAKLTRMGCRCIDRDLCRDMVLDRANEVRRVPKGIDRTTRSCECVRRECSSDCPTSAPMRQNLAN